MFCTVKQAAQTLQASEEQINALLEQGILHVFRTGPHRLVKEADVGALALLRRPQVSAPPETPATLPAPSAAPMQRGRQKARSSSAARQARPRQPIARPSRPCQTQRPPHATASARQRTTSQAQPMARAVVIGPSSGGPAEHWGNGTGTGTAHRPAPRSSPPLSMRQWFWMGLLQDSPIAIALLAGLVLLFLSALVAAVCLLAPG